MHYRYNRVKQAKEFKKMSIAVLKEQKNGYDVLHTYQGWKVAFITYSERFNRREKNAIERHLYTDEIFILLTGRARLYFGESATPLDMKKGVAYLVPKGEWHSVSLSKTAKIAIMENVETGRENTEYMTAKKE